jgi:hypothetical protein
MGAKVGDVEWLGRLRVIDPDFEKRAVAAIAIGCAIFDWFKSTRELTEDDKAIHRAIKHHRP